MYEDHYGLTGRPFGLTPDPRFWFDTATHKKAMAYLGYGLSQGEGFIVVTGDIGAGKTTLVGHLTATIDADRLNVIQIVSTQIAADDLLRTVCAGLNVDAAGLSKAAMLGEIERGLHRVARDGRRTLLIVDEAQALPIDSLEELRMLSNFQAGGHAMLQIFLLGQPEFREKLGDAALEQLRQRVIAMHHLGPMEADELEPYLIHRLGVVGWDGRPRFRTDALATIYAWTGGIPRRINVLMSRVLMHGAIEGIETFTAADVTAVADDLAGDGMTGAVDRIDQPEFELTLDLIEPAPTPRPIVADAPIADDTSAIVLDAPAATEEDDAHPIDAPVSEADDATGDEAVVEDEPVVSIVPDEVDDAAVKPDADDVPIVLTPPEPPAVEAVAESEPPIDPTAMDIEEDRPAMRPVQITAPPRLFDRVRLLGRRPVLAAVDPAPEPEPVATVDPAPEPEPVVPEVEAAPAAVLEWPFRDTASAAPVKPVESERPAAAPVADLDLARRLTAIDKRMEEQDEALRRVLTLLVDWVEKDSNRPDAAELRGRLG